jgi:hypothetical protein
MTDRPLQASKHECGAALLQLLALLHFTLILNYYLAFGVHLLTVDQNKLQYCV